jgi:hypothetical protein
MLRDRRQMVARLAANRRLREQLVRDYGAFLRLLFSLGDWFVTITFRDRHQDSGRESSAFGTPGSPRNQCDSSATTKEARKYPSDPRLDDWEPDSRYRHKPGPPVRDAALREIEHWLLELGWEAAGHERQEIIDALADGLTGAERTDFLKKLAKRCLLCELYNEPVRLSFFYEVRKLATGAIGWVIAEEFGRAGGRWHVHLLIRGARHLRRKKWWRRAFRRFGRSRIEPIHE